MPEAYIVDAIRTPTGKKKGSLAGWHPADLGAIPIKAIVDRTGIDPNAVDDVVWGCVDAVGPQAGNIGRSAWLAAGYSEAIPGVTIDRQCGSSQQAIHFAAQGVMSGTQDLVIAGGVQNMNAIPISSAMYAGQALGFETPFSTSPAWKARYGDEEVNQIYAAEKIAATWGISRQDMEAFAVESNARAERAIDEGRFDSQIVPVGDFRMDETVRRGTTLEGLAGLKTVREGGLITAGVSSQISDGASAVLVASEQAVKAHGLKPRARIHHLTVRGDSPIFMLTAPIPATRHALEKTGLKLSDIDLVEINEAFASVVLAWAKELDADLSKVNVNGGAIALGHPLGATGAKLMTTLLYELERTGGRYGLQTMCEGGGLANVTIIERL
ncbi:MULTISPECIES: acetyl-CoA C-acetyltransferase [Sphingomonadales]|uniref:3-oxoadipyl-CoA/3-oxo-5,6-dehydrosuberyl-CoA thiolase n=1 Tax=Edaphosphingomonas haloaromaticamans TaxID=653954 RepID=A0A1S1HKW5_9SPHN|nr:MULTISPECIES: acetyl-CoA C-acetyltransferase [Sphingomonas]AGH48691.1 acetyl-CoA C-acetyltransferase [Sphingomonas sp. MM-1]MDX3884224.1 acetyl-CoA C-acetyltransferase [Sphingomonas sp.]OHT21180.1 3-oxoadipyl-CoA/3-oxo-5,6-dehydrosuberyl-CoA thiolase [Sphingomonas haloaromaticamans]